MGSGGCFWKRFCMLMVFLSAKMAILARIIFCGCLKNAEEAVLSLLREFGVARLGGNGPIGALLIGANPSTAVLEIR